MKQILFLSAALLLLFSLTAAEIRPGQMTLLPAELFRIGKIHTGTRVWAEQEAFLTKVLPEETDEDPLSGTLWQTGPHFLRRSARIELGKGGLGQARYLRTFLYAPESCQAELFVRADYLIRVLLNRQVILPFRTMEKIRDSRGIRILLPLRKGWNTLTLKAGAGSGGFDVRVRLLSGKHPLTVLPYGPAPAPDRKDLPQLEIMPYPDGKCAMLAFTFDDGSADHYTHAAVLLEKYGFRGTFCLITGLIGKDRKHMTWDQVRSLSKRGHEIDCHTCSHRHMGKLLDQGNYETFFSELLSSVARIERETGIRPRTFCYPGNQCNARSDRYVRECGLLPMRRRIFSGDSQTPEVCRKIIQDLVRERACGVLMIHGIIPGGGGWKPFTVPGAFEELLKTAREQKEDLYVGTYAETEAYANRAEQAVLEALPGTEGTFRFRLVIRPEGMRFPGDMTLLCGNPEVWKILVNGTEVQICRKTEDGIFFRVPPGSLITMIRKDAADVRKNTVPPVPGRPGK